MKDIFEVVVHGRAGQGAKTAAALMAHAALANGMYMQAFPEYGAEREGAPMRSYLRIANREIRVHSGIHKPDLSVVIDSGLIYEPEVRQEICGSEIILINTEMTSEQIKKELKFKGKVYVLDATRIALKEFGKNITNTPMMGAMVKIYGKIPLSVLKKEFKEKFKRKFNEKIMKANMRAMDRGYKEV
jgi:pyruvate ferredoxin oxidoreductase gamma subunit